MKKVLICAALVVSNTAFAWGDREQGILTGIAATMVYQHINEANQSGRVRQSAPVVVYPAPVYAQPVTRVEHYYPQPQTCVKKIFHDSNGNVVSTVTECK